MRWTVVWMQSALDDIAELWMRATDRQVVTNAADIIDAELRVDPDKKKTTTVTGS